MIAVCCLRESIAWSPIVEYVLPKCKKHLLECLKNPIPQHATFQNKGDNISDPRQDNVDTQQSLQIRFGTRCHMASLQRTRNYGTPLFLYTCANYSAKIWAFVGWALTLALSWHTVEYIPDLILTPMEVVYNKPNPSILLIYQTVICEKCLSYSYKTLNGILSSGTLNSKTKDDKKNCIRAYTVNLPKLK